MSTIIGIDLGTTNSVVAMIKQGTPTVITNKEGKKIIPSVVGKSQGGELLVGELARNQYIVAPERTVKSIKRKMGTDERVNIGEESFTPPEISAFILKHLKNIAEQHLGEKVEKAVITVPAYFTDKQRQQTKDAGEIAGLEVVRIINEPTAAALVYGLNREEDQNVVVYDLGGGTFDVSVIEINSGVIEVRATKGDTQLGGDDFDAALVDHIAERFKEEHGIDLREDRNSLARLTRAAENTKIQLSDTPFVTVKDEFIANKEGVPLHLDMEIERPVFESLIVGMLEKTIECVEDALQEAELQEEGIDRVLLVGGSTRIPLVAEMIEQKLGLSPHQEIDPDLCVALGASIQAGIIAGEEIDSVLVDVTPHSLGVEVAEWMLGALMDDQFSVLIRRNSAIPVSKSEVYTTFSPEQKEVKIKVYQGEEPIASHNTFLGEFMLENLERTKKGIPEIIVNFDYDINGMVNVSAQDKKTGKKKEITVVASPDALSEEEKAEATERVSGSEASQEISLSGVNALKERANKVSEVLEDEATKAELQKLVSQIDKAIEKEDAFAVSELQDQLLDFLYDIES